jgi:hypothetical protein
MKEKVRFLGLDVHAETIAVAVAEPEGEVRSLGTIPNHAESIRKLINWRNDYVAIEQWSRFIEEGNYCFHRQHHEQHERFAKTWDNNLRVQGFSEVFTDKCILG